MRAVVQRVGPASVKVGKQITGSIKRGLLVFLGIEGIDENEDSHWIIKKITQLRIFPDKQGVMNLSLLDLETPEILLISQFTLFGNVKKGSRPSFNRAANPEYAIPLYESFCQELEDVLKKPIARGVFGADMLIEAIHDGPVTIILDSKNKGL